MSDCLLYGYLIDMNIVIVLYADEPHLYHLILGIWYHMRVLKHYIMDENDPLSE